MKVQETYSRLRDEFISTVKDYIDQKVLTELKNNYAQDIDSKRKLSRIKNLETLVNILETRDILNYDNISPFYYILKRISQESLLQNKLTEYDNWLRTVEVPQSYNMYMVDNVSALAPSRTTGDAAESQTREERQTRPTLASFTSSNLHSNIPNYSEQQCTGASTSNEARNKEQKLQQTVLSHISEKLGRSWRDVARALNVTESEIDAIHAKHPCDLKEQCREAMKLGMSKYHSNGWKISLVHALGHGRRNDLKKTVEEMILNKS